MKSVPCDVIGKNYKYIRYLGSITPLYRGVAYLCSAHNRRTNKLVEVFISTAKRKTLRTVSLFDINASAKYTASERRVFTKHSTSPLLRSSASFHLLLPAFFTALDRPLILQLLLSSANDALNTYIVLPLPCSANHHFPVKVQIVTDGCVLSLTIMRAAKRFVV